MGCATRSLSIRQTEAMLSYKGSSSLISSYDCGFSNTDIDLHLLTLLKVWALSLFSQPVEDLLALYLVLFYPAYAFLLLLFQCKS